MILNLTNIAAPTEPNVVACTTTASSILDITKSADNAIFVPGMYRFCFDARVWIKFSKDGSTVANPVITDTTGNSGVCWKYEPGEYLITITEENKKYKVISEEDTQVRHFWERGL